MSARLLRRVASLAVLAACPLAAPLAQSPAVRHAAERPFGTLRAQATRQQGWLAERMRTVLPALLRRHDVDMWVV
ncbi:MAG: M24 family metallopeptidase, partial [Gemmatirosa sp.]